MAACCTGFPGPMQPTSPGLAGWLAGCHPLARSRLLHVAGPEQLSSEVIYRLLHVAVAFLDSLSEKNTTTSYYRKRSYHTSLAVSSAVLRFVI